MIVPKDPIIVSESREDNLEKDTDSFVQSASPPPPIGNIVSGDCPAKQARTSAPNGVDFPSSTDKEKKVVENLSSAQIMMC